MNLCGAHGYGFVPSGFDGCPYCEIIELRLELVTERIRAEGLINELKAENEELSVWIVRGRAHTGT